MPVPIGRYPNGLLGLFDSKNIGRTPKQAEELVRAVVDVSPFYLTNARQILSGTTSLINAVGGWGAAGVGPEANQIAYVWRCWGRAGSAYAAGTTYRMQMKYQDIQTTQDVAVGPLTSFVAGEYGAYYGEGGFWMPPDSRLGLWCSQITLGTGQVHRVNADISIINL